MKVRGTDLVLYVVTDLERSIAFYRDTLGMELASRDEYGFAEFTATPTTLTLYQSEGDPPKGDRRGDEACIVLAVDSVTNAVAELQDKGIPVLLDTVDTPACFFAIIADPDGNRVGLHQRKDGTFG